MPIGTRSPSRTLLALLLFHPFPDDGWEHAAIQVGAEHPLDVTTQDPVENVAEGSTEHKPEGDGLDPPGCVAQDDHDRDDDTDRDDGNNRALAR